jgi:hypothetical protein
MSLATALNSVTRYLVKASVDHLALEGDGRSRLKLLASQPGGVWLIYLDLASLVFLSRFAVSL